MFSKLLRSTLRVPARMYLLQRKKLSPQLILVRRSGEILPPSQYDIPIPKKLHLMYALKEYWETIPLFIVTMTAFMLMFLAIAWASKNKVDVVYSTHSRANISRTMDLRMPSIHKLYVINQRYEPWPEMQAVLDKMVVAERRALSRLETCKQV